MLSVIVHGGGLGAVLSLLIFWWWAWAHGWSSLIVWNNYGEAIPEGVLLHALAVVMIYHGLKRLRGLRQCLLLGTEKSCPHLGQETEYP